MAVTFGLLGEVEARIDGRLVDMGPARQRCVLAALLVDANRSVPVEQLMDRVWADRAPQRAREVLYSYLSRLRRALNATDEVQIGRRSGGYLLTVDPLAVDLHHFHHLLARARTVGDDRDAAVLLERALGLWRGEAFATLDTPWLNAVRDNLDRHRWAAELDRNDLALRGGRHTAVLAQLSAAAGLHPLDERLAGQLMVALYRCGRQADALSCYDQMRRRLADDLGVDPSLPLRHLHYQILTSDPTLTAPIPASSRLGPALAQSSVLHQLPMPPHAFTGRTRELADLDEMLTFTADQPNTVVVAAVSGTAGVGKTALAVHWAHRAAAHFPDGQLYVNLRGFDPTGSVMDPAAVVRGFLSALGVTTRRIPPGLDAQAALYRSHLAGKRVLIVLDNARDAGQVRPLLPGTPGCLVLITSRSQLSGLIAGDGAHPVTLDQLPPSEARHLLARRLGDDRVGTEPGAVDQIVACCAGLPLALGIVAARAAAHPGFPLRALAGALRHASSRLDALADIDPATDVRAVFSWSYNTLTSGAARMFRLLGLHPGPDISTAAAASLAGLPLPQAGSSLTELAGTHLIIEHRPGRYAFHDLLRAYAAEQALLTDPPAHHQAAIHRMLDHYLCTAHAAARLLNPHRDPITLAAAQPGVTAENLTDQERSLGWFTTERPVLLAATDHAAATGFHTHTWRLAWTFAEFLDRRGHWHDEAATQLAAIDAARQLADPTLQAHSHRLLGRAYTRLDRLDDAHTHYRQALQLCEQANDVIGQAHTRQDLGRVWARQGHHGQALDEARRALDLFRAVGHRRGQADALNMVGWYCAQLGSHQQALDSCQQALDLHQDLGDYLGEAGAWNGLGYAHHQLGHQSEAITCYRHALALFRTLGDLYEEASTLTKLGDTHHSTGDLQAARDAWQSALEITRDLNHPDAADLAARLKELSRDGRNALA